MPLDNQTELARRRANNLFHQAFFLSIFSRNVETEETDNSFAQASEHLNLPENSHEELEWQSIFQTYLKLRDNGGNAENLRAIKTDLSNLEDCSIESLSICEQFVLALTLYAYRWNVSDSNLSIVEKTFLTIDGENWTSILYEIKGIEMLKSILKTDADGNKFFHMAACWELEHIYRRPTYRGIPRDLSMANMYKKQLDELKARTESNNPNHSPNR